MRADGVHPKVRLGQSHSCEGTESWADLLRDSRSRGTRDPELAVGDGARGL